MPTITQLAPATAASDQDELMISQNGASRKISRGQLIAGLQPQIATPSGTLLGNPTRGQAAGSPAPITIGANLTLRGGTLSADAAPYAVTGLPAGTVPGVADLVPLGQAGGNTAVTYAQFMNGLSSVGNVDVSKLLVRPTGQQSALKLGDLAASTALTSGATMTGPLVLAASPVEALHAATKQYVDTQAAGRLSTAGGSLTGNLMITGSGQSKIQNGSLYIGNSDFFAATLSTSGPEVAKLNKVGSQPTDRAVQHNYYLVNHQGGSGAVIQNMLLETEVESTTADGVWGFLSTLGTTAAGGNGGSTRHVAGYWQGVRSGVPIPASTLLAGSGGVSVRIADVAKFFTGYVAGVGYPVSAAYPLSVLVNGNPYSVIACVSDAAGSTSGLGTLTLSTPLAPADAVPGVGIVGQVVGANLWGGVIEYREQVDLPSSKSGYGQTLELDWFGNNRDDADTRCLVSAVVGKNLTSGSDVEVGNVFGVWPGSGATRTTGASVKRVLQVNLPFSQAVVDTRKATQKSGANAVWLADNQTIALSTDGTVAIGYDPSRAAIVLSGTARFSAPPVLPNYTSAALPAAPAPGAKAYVSNGRKAGEAAGLGSGVEVFADSTGRWISVLSGSPVQA